MVSFLPMMTTYYYTDISVALHAPWSRVDWSWSIDPKYRDINNKSYWDEETLTK